MNIKIVKDNIATFYLTKKTSFRFPLAKNLERHSILGNKHVANYENTFYTVFVKLINLKNRKNSIEKYNSQTNVEESLKQNCSIFKISVTMQWLGLLAMDMAIVN